LLVLRFLDVQVKEIFSSYFDTGAVDRINFDPEIVEGLQACKYFFFHGKIKSYQQTILTNLQF